jgi:pectinesterase
MPDEKERPIRRRVSRRHAIGLVGAGLTGVIAGCSGDSDGGTDTEEPTSGGGDMTEGETEETPGMTPTPTAPPETATETPSETTTEGTTETATSTAVDESEPDIVVAEDGSGDYRQVQSAIDAAPAESEETTVVRIKAGTYKEKLELPESKTNVTFLGAGPNETILTYDDHADKTDEDGDPIGTTGSSSFFVFGDGFTARDLTFRNNAEPVAQAVAIRVDSDRSVFQNCRFIGNQDTLYTHGRRTRQYYHNCYIEGDVDFIFGWATAWFEDCDISCKDDGYVTAASTPEDVEHGYVFHNCRVTGDASDGSVFLGRPWRPYAKTLFRECYLGDVINNQGWHPWSGREETCWYAEYDNEGPGKWQSGRVAWANRLGDLQASYYTYDSVFTAWDPRARLVEA